MLSLYFAKDQAKGFMHTSQALFQLNSFPGPTLLSLKRIPFSFVRDQLSLGTGIYGTGSQE